MTSKKEADLPCVHFVEGEATSGMEHFVDGSPVLLQEKTSLSYMFKHLHNTVTELVTGSEDIRGRLKLAGEHFINISVEALPKHLQAETQDVIEYLTEYKAIPGVGHPFDSDIHITMKKRRKSTAVKIAQKIWMLYFLYEEAMKDLSSTK